jgi:autoinducer-2 kinase
MSEPCVLAIDAGTGGVRAGVFDLAGALLGLSGREWRHHAAASVAGARDLDTTAGWELVGTVARAALAASGIDAGSVKAVTTSSMRGGLVAFGAGHEVLWACSNADARARDEARELVVSGGARELQERGGDGVAMSAAPRLRWLARHEPEIFRRAERFGLVNDWLVGRLTGESVSDPSIGSSSGLFDLERRDWSDESLALCGVERERVPRLVDAGTRVGALTATAAADLGLDRDAVLVMGGADTALARLGLGIDAPGVVTGVCGTFWQQSLSADRCLRDPSGRLRTLCHALPGQWLVEGIVFYAGHALRWFRDAFCDVERREAAARGVDPYELMEALAEQVPPGAGGLVAVLSNPMDVRRWVHPAPAFVGFDLERPEASGKKECIRAIMESAAYVLRAHVTQLEAIGGRMLGELVLAGGAARGRLWPQIVADVAGVPVHIPRISEATLRGGALLAAAALGAGTPATSTAGDRRVAPRPDAVAIYEEDAPRRDRIFTAQTALAERGATTPMWWAPGAE